MQDGDKTVLYNAKTIRELKKCFKVYDRIKEKVQWKKTAKPLRRTVLKTAQKTRRNQIKYSARKAKSIASIPSVPQNIMLKKVVRMLTKGRSVSNAMNMGTSLQSV